VCNLSPNVEAARVVLKGERQIDTGATSDLVGSMLGMMLMTRCRRIRVTRFTPGNDIVTLSLIGIPQEDTRA
jgi:shikimate kinase